MSDNEEFERALIRALESICWWHADYATSGVADVDLLAKIMKHEVTRGGGGPGMYWYAAQGGKKPKIWISKDNPSPWREKPAYAGHALVLMLREKLKIPYPDGTIQMDIFEQHPLEVQP